MNNKAVMISINPEWCEKIFSGEKDIEVRKTKPNIQTPFKCYVYCTRTGKQFFHNGIGEKKLLFRNPRTNELKFDYPFELECEDNADENCYLSGKVIGEFIVDKIKEYEYLNEGFNKWDYNISGDDLENTCLSLRDFTDFGQGHNLYGWHITDVKLYDKPRELREFSKCNLPKFDKMKDNKILCQYCWCTDYCEKKAFYTAPSGLVSCDGTECETAFDEYIDSIKHLSRPPQSWCYVEEV